MGWGVVWGFIFGFIFGVYLVEWGRMHRRQELNGEVCMDAWVHSTSFPVNGAPDSFKMGADMVAGGYDGFYEGYNGGGYRMGAFILWWGVWRLLFPLGVGNP